MYLLWKLQTSLFFVGRRTYKICDVSNIFYPHIHCICTVYVLYTVHVYFTLLFKVHFQNNCAFGHRQACNNEILEKLTYCFELDYVDNIENHPPHSAGQRWGRWPQCGTSTDMWSCLPQQKNVTGDQYTRSEVTKPRWEVNASLRAHTCLNEWLTYFTYKTKRGSYLYLTYQLYLIVGLQ